MSDPVARQRIFKCSQKEVTTAVTGVALAVFDSVGTGSGHLCLNRVLSVGLIVASRGCWCWIDFQRWLLRIYRFAITTTRAARSGHRETVARNVCQARGGPPIQMRLFACDDEPKPAERAGRHTAVFWVRCRGSWTRFRRYYWQVRKTTQFASISSASTTDSSRLHRTTVRSPQESSAARARSNRQRRGQCRHRTAGYGMDQVPSTEPGEIM